MQNFKNSNHKSGKVLVGMIFLVIGSFLLLRSLDILFLPRWIFSWPVILIITGAFIGMRNGFQRPAPYILILMGSVFLVHRVLPGWEFDRFLWPSLIIGAGLWMILGRNRPRNDWKNLGGWDKRVHEPFNTGSANQTDYNTSSGSSLEDKLNSVSIFGGVKKNIISKNFQGGEIVNFFGGSEINLMQADINGRIRLEVVQVFGGTKIIIPANWAVHSEMVAIFGGIEDKRPPQIISAPEKVLIIEGTSVFGGIDIKSF
jgi:predicted membrane protein